jgi:hypothetical protein
MWFHHSHDSIGPSDSNVRTGGQATNCLLQHISILANCFCAQLSCARGTLFFFRKHMSTTLVGLPTTHRSTDCIMSDLSFECRLPYGTSLTNRVRAARWNCQNFCILAKLLCFSLHTYGYWDQCSTGFLCFSCRLVTMSHEQMSINAYGKITISQSNNPTTIISNLFFSIITVLGLLL